MTTTVRGNGIEAKEWLEDQELVAKIPAIRSSDYETVLSCPFQYYLSRRLGLVSALRWSPALSRGSWFHRRLELFQEPSVVAQQKMEEWFRERCEELKELCDVRGIIGKSRSRIFDREEKDMLMASAWFDAMKAFQVPSKGSVIDYLNRPYFKLLGTEVTAEYTHPEYGRLLAQYDILLYHEKQNSLYVVDAKTCSGSTIDRLSTCPIEFQTKHYLHVLNYLAKAEKLTQKYQIPRDAKVAGMIHIAVQKPTIEFGMNDRDFTESPHTISRGPRKGQVETRRTYSGEPRWENYRDRCIDWYLANGRYQDKEIERSQDPPINFSLTPGSDILDKYSTYEYHRCLQLVKSYATCEPTPGCFPKSANYLRGYSRLSPFTPFYLNEVKDWPSIIATDGFMVEDRDDVKPDLSA